MGEAGSEKTEARPGWEQVLAHVKERLEGPAGQEELKRLSVGEALRLAKILRSLEGGGDGVLGKKQASDLGVGEEEGEERAAAALRVLGERQEEGDG